MWRIICATMAVLVSLAPANGNPTHQKTVYESLDGRTILTVLGAYYYLGPRNHPAGGDFMQKYGQKFERVSIRGGECLSLGIFKLARIQEGESICQNVRIIKSSYFRHKKISNYTGSCFILKGNGCSVEKGQGKSALVYGYTIESGRGITKIYLSDPSSRDNGNVLTLKMGPALFK